MPPRENPFVMAGREVVAILRGDSVTHRELRDRLTVVVGLSIVVDLLCGLLAYGFEHGAAQTEIHTVGDAL